MKPIFGNFSSGTRARILSLEATLAVASPTENGRFCSGYETS